MKTFAVILLVIVFALSSCGSVKSKTTNNTNRMEFTITKIKNEKDGQTLFLKDGKGRQFTTVISIPNGNFVEVKVGNVITLETKEILEMHPAIIISKNIKVIDKGSASDEFEYEKIEEEIYWINSRTTEAQGTWGQLMDCLQFQKSEELNKNGKWDVICDDIKHFNFIEGKYYKVKVLKKWIENHENLMYRSPYDLELVTVLSKENDSTYVSPIKINISTNKTVYKVGEPIELSMEIKNTGSKPYKFLPWGTPFENRFTRGCLQILHTNEKVPYSGIMVKRMPPTEKDYITLKKDETYNGKVNLLDGYKLTKKGTYTIQFEETYDGMPTSNSISISIK